VESERILAGLNAEQRAAAEATRGPVCILAGAGTGKTTTITRRIAYQVASGAFQPSQLVAVTFTDKAAGELRSRLAGLGVEGVRASTFHSAALALRDGSPAIRAGSWERRRCCSAGSGTACRSRTGSVPPAISRPRSNGRRTGG
jgi:DNA helicase-2/ATP-dependent DNA helicase PcrA